MSNAFALNPLLPWRRTFLISCRILLVLLLITQKFVRSRDYLETFDPGYLPECLVV